MWQKKKLDAPADVARLISRQRSEESVPKSVKIPLGVCAPHLKTSPRRLAGLTPD